MKNKTIGFLLLGLGIVGGGTAMIAAQTHAQQVSTPAAVAQSTGDVQTPSDTDNIQDPNGVEQPDVQNQSTKAPHHDQGENEAHDTDGGALED